MKTTRVYAVAAVLGVCGGLVGDAGHAALATDAATPAPTPVSKEARPTVPHAKFRTAVLGWRAARARADRLERVLRHDPTVQEAITLASIVYRIDRDDLSSTAWCESRHRPDARNGQYVGLMQLGDGFRGASPFFPALDPWSPYANVMAAAHVISVQGYRQWECGPRGAFRR